MKPLNLRIFAAPLATLAFTALIVGCPSNNPTTPASASPKASKEPGASSSGAPSSEPSTAAGGGTSSAKPSTTPSSNATSLPTGTTAPSTAPSTSTSGAPSTTPSTVGSATPSAVPSTVASATPSASPSTGTAQYIQVERLGRPAINEGLIRSTTLNGVWNSVMPDVDGTDAATPIVTNATETLKAFGNTDPQIATLYGQLLPDVMRIDTTKTSGYATSFGNANPLALDNLSQTKKIPIGGRMITDDVVDVTLILIVPGGLPDAAKITTLEGDNVGYTDTHKPVLTEFPYLAAPD